MYPPKDRTFLKSTLSDQFLWLALENPSLSNATEKFSGNTHENSLFSLSTLIH